MASPKVTASQAETVRGDSKLYNPSGVRCKYKPPLDKFGRYFEKAHSRKEAEKVGTCPHLEHPSPKATAFET